MNTDFKEKYKTKIQEFINLDSKKLIITGKKGIGKTTLSQNIIQNQDCFQILTYAKNRIDGIPEKIVLQHPIHKMEFTIGIFSQGKMQPQTDVLDTIGLSILQEALQSQNKWVLVDEIGYLELSSPKYCAMLEEVLNRKKVIAVLRKQQTVLFEKLKQRNDCLWIDLDLDEI